MKRFDQQRGSGPSRRDASRRGYTLVEVLVVVVILGIASAVVVPQLLAAGTLGIQAAARLVVADVLFAQNEAIAAQENREVVFDVADNAYRLQRFDPDTGLDEVLTQGWKNGQVNNYAVDFDDDERFDGITIESVQVGGADATRLEFDDLGSPLLADEMQIVIAFQEQTLTVSVQPFTGRVTVD
ncbi:MAG: prepilin-type N-terminal cleavage/methylation domain-containing protein [Planctomycetota bacterium]